MLSCICPLIDHRLRQNVVRTKKWHEAIAECVTDVIRPGFAADFYFHNFTKRKIFKHGALFSIRRETPTIGS